MAQNRQTVLEVENHGDLGSTFGTEDRQNDVSVDVTQGSQATKSEFGTSSPFALFSAQLESARRIADEGLGPATTTATSRPNVTTEPTSAPKKTSGRIPHHVVLSEASGSDNDDAHDESDRRSRKAEKDEWQYTKHPRKPAIPTFPTVTSTGPWVKEMSANLVAAGKHIDGKEDMWIKECLAKTLAELEKSGIGIDGDGDLTRFSHLDNALASALLETKEKWPKRVKDKVEK